MDVLKDLVDILTMAVVWAALALGFVALYLLVAGA